MKYLRLAPLTTLILVSWLSACSVIPSAATTLPFQGAATSPVATLRATGTPTQEPSPLPTVTATMSPSPTVTPASIGGVRACAYVPGVSVPVKMPTELLLAATPTPLPTPALPANSPVSADVTEQQLKVFQQVYDLVEKNYVYRDFNGQDWKATGDRYRALINKGLKQEDFYIAMRMLIDGLGDGHSAFLTPDEVQALAKETMGKADYVGIGALVDLETVPGQVVITEVMAGSPAEEAGLLPHDHLISVDGGPVLDKDQQPRTLGPEGTPVTVRVQTPGQPERDVQLVRRRITSQPRVDYCLFPGTRLGYIRWTTFSDTTVVNQTQQALKAMSASGPLSGLVLDNRNNGGGLLDVMDSLLGLFTQGKQGDFVSQSGKTPLIIKPQDLGGSQHIPLVVLIGPDTGSAGEISSGLLQLTRGARLLGENTGGHVEELLGFDLVDGSRLNLAVKTFQPLGLSNNVWEHHGVSPDVQVPERWDLFTEATDPAIARALDILLEK